MSNREFTFKIKKPKECYSLDINWIGTPGILLSCIEEDDKSKLTFTLDPNADSHCIEAIILCLGKDGKIVCQNCEPYHFRKCFCLTDKDCVDGSPCSDDGVCTGKCTEEEKAQGKVSYEDGCKCPDHKPYLHPKTNQCSVCVDGEIHPENNCLICKEGKWALKDCGEGSICDEDTGDCLPDCSKNDDGRTYYDAETGKCKCLPGYEFNSRVMKCLPIPTPCKKGQVRNPLTGECEYPDCGEDMVWDVEKEKCVPIGCKDTPCENGLDCDKPDCGCHPVEKECVSCEDYPEALGCNNGKKDDCSYGFCDENNPCIGEDCTCVDNVCVNCNNFPCDECGEHDCACTKEGNCEGVEKDDSCRDTHTIKEDCTLKSTLSLSKRCKCNTLGSGIYLESIYNTDVNSLDTKYYGDFTYELKKKYANNQSIFENLEYFDDVTINNETPISGSVTLTVIPVYKYNNKDFVPANDSERSYMYGKTFIKDNEKVSKTISLIDKKTKIDFKNIKLGVDNNIIKIYEYSKHGEIESVISYELTGYKLLVKYSDIEFENNCTYKGNILYKTTSKGESIETTNNKHYFTIKAIKSNSEQFPLLTWERMNSTTPELNKVFRNLYKIPTHGNTYSDTLHTPQKFKNDEERGLQTLDETNLGGLLPTLDYKSTWTCTCSDPEIIENLTYCDIEFKEEDFKILSGVTCNDTIKIVNDFPLCNLNKDLRAYGWDEHTANKYQTKYLLYINDKLVETFSDKNFQGLHNSDDKPFKGYTYIHADEIKSVSLKMNHDNSCEATHSIFLFIAPPLIESKCENGKNQVKIKGFVNSEIDNVSINMNESIKFNGNSLIIPNIEVYKKPNSNNYTFDVQFANGCIKRYEKEITEKCCPDYILDVEAMRNGEDVKLNLQFDNKGEEGVILNNVKIVDNGNVIQEFTLTDLLLSKGRDSGLYSLSLNNIIPGKLYVVKAVTNSGCEVTNRFTLEEIINYILTTDTPSICPNGDAILLLSSDNENVVINSYEMNGNLYSVSSVNPAVITLNNLSESVTVNITKVNGVYLAEPLVQEITVLTDSTPDINITLNGVELNGRVHCAEAIEDMSIKIAGLKGLSFRYKIESSNGSILADDGFNEYSTDDLNIDVNSLINDMGNNNSQRFKITLGDVVYPTNVNCANPIENIVETFTIKQTIVPVLEASCNLSRKLVLRYTNYEEANVPVRFSITQSINSDVILYEGTINTSTMILVDEFNEKFLTYSYEDCEGNNKKVSLQLPKCSCDTIDVPRNTLTGENGTRFYPVTLAVTPDEDNNLMYMDTNKGMSTYAPLTSLDEEGNYIYTVQNAPSTEIYIKHFSKADNQCQSVPVVLDFTPFSEKPVPEATTEFAAVERTCNEYTIEVNRMENVTFEELELNVSPSNKAHRVTKANNTFTYKLENGEFDFELVKESDGTVLDSFTKNIQTQFIPTLTFAEGDTIINNNGETTVKADHVADNININYYNVQFWIYKQGTAYVTSAIHEGIISPEESITYPGTLNGEDYAVAARYIHATDLTCYGAPTHKNIKIESKDIEPKLSNKNFVFVVDRSSSMNNEKPDVATEISQLYTRIMDKSTGSQIVISSVLGEVYNGEHTQSAILTWLQSGGSNSIVSNSATLKTNTIDSFNNSNEIVAIYFTDERVIYNSKSLYNKNIVDSYIDAHLTATPETISTKVDELISQSVPQVTKLKKFTDGVTNGKFYIRAYQQISRMTYTNEGDNKDKYYHLSIAQMKKLWKKVVSATGHDSNNVIYGEFPTSGTTYIDLIIDSLTN